MSQSTTPNSNSMETSLTQKLKSQIDILSDRNASLEKTVEQELASKLVFEQII